MVPELGNTNYFLPTLCLHFLQALACTWNTCSCFWELDCGCTRESIQIRIQCCATTTVHCECTSSYHCLQSLRGQLPVQSVRVFLPQMSHAASVKVADGRSHAKALLFHWINIFHQVVLSSMSFFQVAEILGYFEIVSILFYQ